MRHATAMMALALVGLGAVEDTEPRREDLDDAPEPHDLRLNLDRVDRNLDRLSVDEADLMRQLAAYSETRAPTRAERRALAHRTGQPTRWGRVRG